MGILLGWFQCNDIEELEKMKENAKTDEERKAIDEKIAELKGKN